MSFIILMPAYGNWILPLQLCLPALISQGSRNLYGLGVDPTTGNIYVSDAIDYVQKGKVYRYHPDGSLIDSFTAGVIPGGFYFQ